MTLENHIIAILTKLGHLEGCRCGVAADIRQHCEDIYYLGCQTRLPAGDPPPAATPTATQS